MVGEGRDRPGGIRCLCTVKALTSRHPLTGPTRPEERLHLHAKDLATSPVPALFSARIHHSPLGERARERGRGRGRGRFEYGHLVAGWEYYTVVAVEGWTLDGTWTGRDHVDGPWMVPGWTAAAVDMDGRIDQICRASSKIDKIRSSYLHLGRDQSLDHKPHQTHR